MQLTQAQTTPISRELRVRSPETGLVIVVAPKADFHLLFCASRPTQAAAAHNTAMNSITHDSGAPLAPWSSYLISPFKIPSAPVRRNLLFTAPT